MKTILVCLLLLLFGTTNAQKFFSRSGEISFLSDAPLENIEAVNHKATTVYDNESGAIQWSVLIKAFHFEKALMEEHFNENYLESSTYPKASFKGKVAEHTDLNLNIDGQTEVIISGVLEIHGVSREITTTATFSVTNGAIRATSDFDINLADFDIEIPNVVRDNISETVKVVVNVQYELLKK